MRVKTNMSKRRLQFKFRLAGKQSAPIAKQHVLAEVGTAQDPLTELDGWAAQEALGGRCASGTFPRNRS